MEQDKTALEYLDLIEKELQANEWYLRRTGKFHAAYQYDKYQRMYHWIALIRQKLEQTDEMKE